MIATKLKTPTEVLPTKNLSSGSETGDIAVLPRRNFTVRTVTARA